MPFDYSDPRLQLFLTERRVQDNLRCMRWFLKHKDEMISDAAVHSAKNKHYTEEQIKKTVVEANIKVLSNQHAFSSLHRRKRVLTDSADATALNQFLMKAVVPSVMKPVDVKHSRILYKQLASGGGRKAYLNARKYKLPEQKYHDCVTTSSVYGWALKESLVGCSAPKFRRYATFARELLNSGVHMDPPHYEPPAERFYKKCIGFE
ncbi:uncharacterized protein LOC124636759 [Helicoverpa zea]|uniref:uncharacterized protein LOC124636759 n=1 Tax=Helicoverpa zea TaxID=7113 RepID=UPI000B3941E2|nr:uncharacterized protein LOC124636759 [Helicoverpa zea]